MKTVIKHKNVQEFLDKVKIHLEQNELENNLILGVCNGIPNKLEENNNLVFLSIEDEEGKIVCSIKTISKAIIGGTSNEETGISKIANFYIQHNIDLSGIVGQRNYSNSFATTYHKEIERKKEFISHKLEKTEKIEFAKGQMALCEEIDVDLIVDWTSKFQEETNLLPRKSIEQIEKDSISYIKNRLFYKWQFEGKTVSIACIIRETANYGIVGGVYTPLENRGNGYASSLVYELSNEILKTFKFCGLFTDKDNPTSNKIYRNIGYIPNGSILDITFK